MADAYIYDAVRTPRGKGKKDGSLHEITGLSLATQVLEALRDRNDLDTSKVDDVILGCVTPVGEQGADIARTAVVWAQPALSTAVRAMSAPCSPTGVTQPRMTSSTFEVSRSLRSRKASSTWVARLRPVISCSDPSFLPLPRGVRTAS